MTTTGPDGSTDGPAEPLPAETTSTFALGHLGLGSGGEAAAEEAATDAIAHGATEEDAGAVEALVPGTALLVVQRGPNAGSRYVLETDLTTAGRHPDADVFLDDVTVSRRHAEFRRDAEGFRVVDVGSLNGTYVNRQRIDDALLSGGDEVQIGKYRLLYFPAAPPGGAA